MNTDPLAAIIEGNLSLIGTAKARLHEIGWGHFSEEDFEELEGVGRLALCRAARHFRPEVGTHFSTYAVASILGAMRHYLRDSHQYRRQAKRREAGEAPIESVPLDTVLYDDGEASHPAFAVEGPERFVLDRVEADEARAALKVAISHMPPAWAASLWLMFGCGLSQGEAGKRTGYSQMQLCRMQARLEQETGWHFTRCRKQS